jgi:hypothetical protein
MATSSEFDAVYQDIAKRIAQGRTGTGSGTPDYQKLYPSIDPQRGIGPAGKMEGAWSLGQGIIDVLSTGTYLTAGIGKKLGSNITAAQQGEAGGVLDALNPFSLIGAGFQGIADKRTWSQNLQDTGMSEEEAMWPGLALDIAIDPIWLIPGGAIAAGIKGGARGLVAGAGANKAGIKYTKEAFDEASKRLEAQYPGRPTDRRSAELKSPIRSIGAQDGKTIGLDQIAELFPATGTKISSLSGQGLSNLYQGIKQANIENYSEWAALRKVQKATKAVRKAEKTGSDLPLDRFRDRYNLDPFELLPRENILPIVAKAADDVAGDTSKAADTPPLERDIEDVVADVTEATKKAIDEESQVAVKAPLEKDASVVKETVNETLDTLGVGGKSLNAQARDAFSDSRVNYLSSRGLPAPAVDVSTLATVKANPALARDIARDYDKLPKVANDPATVASYTKMVEEVRDQFKYMTEELGIKVEFVDVDPYTAGKGIPSSEAMMRDLVDNKTLKVLKTSDDQVHPFMSRADNDMLRAVHDYFGHAASGRGFHQDGEEAAWISHSVMFSPLARRAMTTETRGQNSWVNEFGTDAAGRPIKFAEQKAALLPEAYAYLPSEYARAGSIVEATNDYVARTAAILLGKSDIILEDLGMVAQPLKQMEYKPADFASIKSSLEKITDSDLIRPGTPEHKMTLTGLQALKSRFQGGGRINTLANDLEAIQKGLNGAASDSLTKVLNTQTDASDLLARAAAAEGRTLDAPKPFSATTWSAGKTYGKPAFSIQALERHFPGDELFNDPQTLALAMGTVPPAKAGVRALKGETKEQALTRKQDRIWEDFRARNAERLPLIKQAERDEWKTANSVPLSDIFVENGAGVIGIGKVPLNLPRDVFSSQNGRVTTSLALMMKYISAMIVREPTRMVRGTGGLETAINSQIQKRVPVTKKKIDEDGKAYNFEEGLYPEDEIIEFARTRVRGAKFDVVGADDLPITDWLRDVRAGRGLPAGAKLIPSRGVDGTPNQQAQQLIVRLKELDKAGRAMPEIDRLQPVVQKWMIEKFDAATKAVSSSNVRISKTVNSTDKEGITLLAKKLMDENPKVKTLSDAELLVAGFEDAIPMLSKRPKKKIFIKRDDLLPARGADQPKVERDPDTGRVIPGGKKYSLIDELIPTPDEPISAADATILTSKGSQYIGRAPSRNKLDRRYEPQFTEGGQQQLAAVANVMKAIDTVAGAMTARQLTASPEQAQLLGRVLNELNISVAPDASPQQIFKQFKKDAALGFRELVEGIEAAAKREAILNQAPKIFTMSTKENMTLLEAIEKSDPGEIQRAVQRFTDDALDQVNASCRARFGSTSPTDDLDRLGIGEVIE